MTTQPGGLDPLTPILLWNGTKKLARDITSDDVLVGDDGDPRYILNMVQGEDEMYEVSQIYGEPYRVNRHHILNLHMNLHKNIKWRERSQQLHMTYFDISSNSVKTKSVSVGRLTKDEAYLKIQEFVSTIPDNNIFDVPIKDYLKLSSKKQDFLKSMRNMEQLNWPKRPVPIDPYIFGMWLGDGNSNGKAFSSADQELVKEWVKWTDTIGVEVIHWKNSGDKEHYLYGLRRRGADRDGIVAVGHRDHSSATCHGCTTSEKIHPACDWVYEEKNNELYRVNDDPKNKANPYVEILRTNGLLENKHIPEIYIVNDIETRLQLLAGLIDTDGYLDYFNEEANQKYVISQREDLRGQIIDMAGIIAQSLGFKVTIFRSHETKKYVLINGDIHRIPTKLPRKRSTKKSCNNYMGAQLKLIRWVKVHILDFKSTVMVVFYSGILR
jgi:hypothetical protein